MEEARLETSYFFKVLFLDLFTCFLVLLLAIVASPLLSKFITPLFNVFVELLIFSNLKELYRLPLSSLSSFICQLSNEVGCLLLLLQSFNHPI